MVEGEPPNLISLINGLQTNVQKTFPVTNVIVNYAVENPISTRVNSQMFGVE